MEKILLAIDAINPDRKALEFACYLGRLTKSKITGIFLENLVEEERLVLKEVRGKEFMELALDEDSDEYKVKTALINNNIACFKEACTAREVSYKVHRDRGTPTTEILKESRFADVLVVDAATSFDKHYKSTPTEFIKNILKGSECPVIIAPEHFEGIDEIIFTYDGSSSAVFAMRQFTYLFPQFRHMKLSIVTENEAGEWQDPEKYNLKEWLNEHYSNFHFEVVKGNTDRKLFDHVCNRKNSFLVMGAYSRSALSQFFQRSHADILIRTGSQPIFITHL